MELLKLGVPADEEDVPRWRLAGSGVFSSVGAYALLGDTLAIDSSNAMEESMEVSRPMRYAMFPWLVRHGGLKTNLAIVATGNEAFAYV